MRILNWMQNKLNGKQGTKKSSGGSTANDKNVSLQETRKEEFSDWPHGLLAIGTFGNTNIKEEAETSHRHHDLEEIPSNDFYEEQFDFTPEEVGKLQKELTKLLSRKPNHESGYHKGDHQSSNASRNNKNVNLPLDKFLNCPSSLEVDRTLNFNAFGEDSEDRDISADDDDDDLSKHSNATSSVALSKLAGKDIHLDGKNNTEIRKRSISFLLKKMFVCRGGFAPAPSLRDPIPETRMEKLLRAILHKNMCAQKSAARSKRKYIENRHCSNATDTEDQQLDEERGRDGCKWVKTDSEYIVLEI